MIGAPIVKLGTKCLHKIDEKRGRKISIFNNLMGTTSTLAESEVNNIKQIYHRKVAPDYP